MSRWPHEAISSLGTVVTGSTPRTSEQSFYGGDIPFVTPLELDQITPVLTAARTLSETGGHEVRLIPEGAVMVCCIGSLGKVGIAGREVATNQQINSVVFDRRRIWPRFGFHACRRLKSKLEMMAPATTIPIVSKSKFERLEIPVPPLSEQQRIAEVLDRAEALRVKRRAAIDQLDTLAESIFLDLFGDPAQNPLCLPIVTLGNLFSEPPCYGSMIPPTGRGNWVSLRVGNIQNWKLDLTDRKYIDLPSDSLQRYTLKDGDIVLARAIASREYLGKCIVAHPGADRWAFDSHLMRLRLDPNRIVPEYLVALLQTTGGRSLFLSVTRRSAVQFNVNTREISCIKLPLPPLDTQLAFSLRTGRVECVRNKHREFISAADALFSLLQQRAFEGEL